MDWLCRSSLRQVNTTDSYMAIGGSGGGGGGGGGSGGGFGGGMGMADEGAFMQKYKMHIYFAQETQNNEKKLKKNKFKATTTQKNISACDPWCGYVKAHSVYRFLASDPTGSIQVKGCGAQKRQLWRSKRQLCFSSWRNGPLAIRTFDFIFL